MEERKTAAIVLSVLLLIGLIVIYFCNRKERTLTFGTCSVRIDYSIKEASEVDEYRAAKNKLALCLCNIYQKNGDTAVANQITCIYRQCDAYNHHDSLIYSRNIDSLLTHRATIFDTLVLVD